ncbi:response regulator [Microvirga sp. BT291]|nr:response regulator [Microvirga pudoricolor]
MGAFLTVVLKKGDDAIFWGLTVTMREPRQWSEDDKHLLSAVAEKIRSSVERARTEQALRESEERLRQFATHSTHILWTLDLDTKELTRLGSRSRQTWPSELPPPANLAEWLAAVHPEDRGRVQGALDKASLGDASTEEYRVVQFNSQIRWLKDTFFPVPDTRGRIRQVGGIAQDITQSSGSFVYVIDGDDTSSVSLVGILGRAGYDVRAFTSSASFMAAAPAIAPGCVVCDIRQPSSGGLMVPREIKALRADLPVVVVGQPDGDTLLGVKAMKAGASDFVPAPYKARDILLAVASVAGQARASEAKDPETKMAKIQVQSLPEREMEVLRGLLAGGTNKVIAQDLNLSPRTVEIYRARVMQRLNVNSLPELVLVAAKAGLQPGSRMEDQSDRAD